MGGIDADDEECDEDSDEDDTEEEGIYGAEEGGEDDLSEDIDETPEAEAHQHTNHPNQCYGSGNFGGAQQSYTG